EVEVEAQFQGIRGYARNAIARADRDRSVLVGGRVVRARRREWRAEPGVDVAVTNTRRELAEAPACRELDALTTRLPDILEEAGIERALASGDELDIFVEIGAIEGSRPWAHRSERAAGAELDGPGYDLLERRIAEEYIGQLARCGGVGAGQLHRRRRAHAFVVCGVGGEG